MSVLVSIIIDNYNCGRFLADAVDSALAQTYQPTEVIVVDDGSTDESRSVLARYHGRIHTVYKSNGGQASAFNAGFAACAGQWVALLDADDRFEASKIASLMAASRTYPSAHLLAHPLEYIDDHGRQVHPSPQLGPELQVGMFDRRARVRRGQLGVRLPATSGLFVRRDLLAQILPMPVDIEITADNYLKIAAAALAPIAVVGGYLGQQRLHAHNLYTGRDSTVEGRIEKELIAARTRMHLAKQFPFLAPLAWVQYGRTMHALKRHGAGDRVASLQWLQAAYEPKTWPIRGYLYAGAAFLLGYVRDVRDALHA